MPNHEPPPSKRSSLELRAGWPLVHAKALVAEYEWTAGGLESPFLDKVGRPAALAFSLLSAALRRILVAASPPGLLRMRGQTSEQ